VGLLFFVPTDKDFGDGATDRNGDRLVRQALRFGARVCVFHPSLPYHAKLIVADDEHMIIGSHSWTGDSLVNSGDLSLEIQDKQLAGEAQRWLLSLSWRSGSRLVI
jgi:phosphatidylserine/phosphatidylglycerophosphate/cardiolipin synthase-like enzyme